MQERIPNLTTKEKFLQWLVPAEKILSADNCLGCARRKHKLWKSVQVRLLIDSTTLVRVRVGFLQYWVDYKELAVVSKLDGL